jgi:hypothetical protein
MHWWYPLLGIPCRTVCDCPRILGTLWKQCPHSCYFILRNKNKLRVQIRCVKRLVQTAVCKWTKIYTFCTLTQTLWRSAAYSGASLRFTVMFYTRGLTMLVTSKMVPVWSFFQFCEVFPHFLQCSLRRDNQNSYNIQQNFPLIWVKKTIQHLFFPIAFSPKAFLIISCVYSTVFPSANHNLMQIYWSFQSTIRKLLVMLDTLDRLQELRKNTESYGWKSHCTDSEDSDVKDMAHGSNPGGKYIFHTGPEAQPAPCAMDTGPLSQERVARA